MYESRVAREAQRADGQPTVLDIDIAARKRFLHFDDEDSVRLRVVDDIARSYVEPVVEAFYEQLEASGELKSLFSDPEALEVVKLAQKDYFLRLTQGEYGSDYIESRLNMGLVHERAGLSVRTYLGLYYNYLSDVTTSVMAPIDESVERLETFLSLLKLVFLDIGLAIDAYILQRERTIAEQKESILELQRQTIRELSTPVLQVRDGILILPIIGVIDSQRAKELTESLLFSVRANRAKVVIIDITGVATVDSAIANHLVQTVEASRLMGAKVIVSGLSAEVAQTLVTIGVDLSKINTVGDMQGGMDIADQMLGYKVTRVAQEFDQDN